MGKIQTDPKQINKALQEFYQSQFSDHMDPLSLERRKNFIQRVILPVVVYEQRDLLNGDITDIEILSAIKRFG